MVNKNSKFIEEKHYIITTPGKSGGVLLHTPVENKQRGQDGGFISLTPEENKQGGENRGRKKEVIMMTGDAFCDFALMAETIQGQMCRDFVKEVTRGIKRLRSAIDNGRVELKYTDPRSDHVTKRIKTCQSNKILNQTMKEHGASGADYAKVAGITSKTVTGKQRRDLARERGVRVKDINMRDEMTPEQLCAAELVEMMATRGIKEGEHEGHFTQYYNSLVDDLISDRLRNKLHNMEMGKGVKLSDIRKTEKAKKIEDSKPSVTINTINNYFGGHK